MRPLLLVMMAVLVWPAGEGCVAREGADQATVSNALVAIKEEGGSDAFDVKAAAILIAAYDVDGSGWVDTVSEVDAIPCGVLVTLDRLVAPYDKARSGLTWTYGFKPDTKTKKFDYVGKALGFDPKMRSAAFGRMQDCKLPMFSDER